MTQGMKKVEDRLHAVEHKIDRILDRLNALVRLEAQHDGAVQRIDRHDFRLDHLEKDVNRVKEIQAADTKLGSMLERAAWVAVSAVVGLVVYFLR